MTFKKGCFILGGAVFWAAVCVVLWFGVLKLNTIHNDFPLDYHPDEGSKAEQLVTNTRNYNHPQLMLEAALLVMPKLTPPMDYDDVTKQARVVSAMFVASAVVLMALAGAVTAGPMGFVAVAICTGLCPSLIQAGHYLKEDASLVFGMACVILVGALFARARRGFTLMVLALLLGAACGVAASGKYCGVVFLPLALLLVVMHLAKRPFWIGAAVVVLIILTSAAVWSGINYRVFGNWDGFVNGFSRESEHSATGHSGVALERPSPHFVDVVWDECVTPIAVLLVIAPFAWLLQRRADCLGPWLILAMAGYLGMLSMNAIPFVRYALPATVIAYMLGGLGLAWIARLTPFARPWRRDRPKPIAFEPEFDPLPSRPGLGGRWPLPRVGTTLFLLGLIPLTIVLGARAADVNAQFGNDSRDALRAWVRTLPPGTRIAADGYTALNGRYGPPELQTPATVMRRMWAAEAGSVAMLQRMKIDYVAVASSSDDRFFGAYTHGEPGDESWYVRAHVFYTDLAMHYPIAWQHVAAHPLHEFVNPDIRVYDIRPQPTPRGARPALPKPKPSAKPGTKPSAKPASRPNPASHPAR
ncbi:MAG: hypothetical protein ACTHM6_10120 [Tepidisphaeraceae bacterium]